MKRRDREKFVYNELYTNKKIEDLNIDNTIFKISSQKTKKEKLILEILK